MSSGKAAALLWDADRAVDRIFRFVAGRSYDDYIGDEMLRSAVERQLEIAGEALTALRRIDPDLASTIRELPRAVGLRNTLIHGYATVDHTIVRDVIQNHLSGLRTALGSALRTSE